VTQQIGRYEILEEIGRGAMGVVFKARDPLIGRAVALKTITSGVAESADLLERFYREARAAGGLQHPNIVTIYEMGESGGTPFIAMEYLEGESLEKIIARKPRLPLATKVGYVAQTCRALEFAHRRGVVHRDIKPANIMVTADGVIKVVDFGIARLADTSKTQTGALLGTLAYMSPEQLRGERADARCDVWALGVVFYELIAYQRPFTGENHAALLLSILQKEPPPIRHLAPECPIAVERVVSRALLKDDKARYFTMKALLADLENVSSSLGLERTRTAGEQQILPAISQATPAPTQRLDMHDLGGAEPARTSKSAPPAARRPNAQPASLASPARVPGAALTPQPEAHHPVKPPAMRSAEPRARSRRKAATIFALLAIAVLVALGVVRQRTIVSEPADAQMPLNVPPSAPPLAATTPEAPNPATPSIPVTVPASSPPTAPKTVSIPAADSAVSLETQQRRLIDLAHQAADAHDYKAAQTRLDQAARLNGPLNSLAAGLRQEFSEEAYGADLKRSEGQEQTLWDEGIAELQEGQIDAAEKALRNILVLPARGRHWADAERYVDELIPQRRQEQQLWTEAQMQSTSVERGHLLKEIKALDEVMAEGGAHEQQARQMRDAVIRQIVRENARRNGQVDPTLSEGYEAQLSGLETQFVNLALKGDAAALEGLQELRPKFKALADAGGPLAMDARDYLNSVIPKTQKQIEDNLAAAASELSANAEYERAVKDYARAVATQNAGLLRGRVLAAFQQIAESGGIRAKEAERYVHILIPAALKKSGQ
jgi:eukaryotic-like serine/threonine-protein kinase